MLISNACCAVAVQSSKFEYLPSPSTFVKQRPSLTRRQTAVPWVISQ
jgi:hypothetical protein